MSEIIHCVDSEITAGTAVVMKNGSTPVLRNVITASKAKQFHRLA